MRRVILIGVASVIALVASMAVAGPLPKGGTFAGIAGGGGGSGLSGTIADNQVVCGTGASTVDSNASLTCTGGALGATTVTGTGLVQGSDLAASDLAAGSTASVDVASENAAAWTYCQGSGVVGTVISGVNRANTCEVGFEGGAQTVIWTADAQPMYFATNATLAMTIEADQDALFAQDVTVTALTTLNGNVVLGSDTADAVDINADDIEFVNDTVVTLPGADGLYFNSGQVKTHYTSGSTSEFITSWCTGGLDCNTTGLMLVDPDTGADDFVSIRMYSENLATSNPRGMIFDSYLASADDIAAAYAFRFLSGECTAGLGSTCDALDTAGIGHTLWVNGAATTLMTLSDTGILSPSAYASQSNCADTAGAAACSAAPAGAVVIDDGSTTVVVSTTAVTASSRIFLQWDETISGVTCNTSQQDLKVSARSTSPANFTITQAADPAGANPSCISYFIIN